VYEKVLFIVDKETLLPIKQEMVVKIIFSSDRDEKTEISIETTREYSNWKTNTGIPDYKFVLALPDDVQIIDVSQETKEKLIELFMN
jgi:outer membrane lipoprotein-sorting protein